ncbi:MAG: hypothetical protein WBR32_11465 [Pseudolabrys sp.]
MKSGHLFKWPEPAAVAERSLIMTNHDPRMMRQELERVREWAIEQLAAGTEPPWSWYQYMKLREATESILAGMDVAQPMEDSEKSAPHLRLVGAVGLQLH